MSIEFESNVDNFSWVIEFLSQARMAKYLTDSDGGFELALDRYTQDLGTANALLLWIHLVEVGLRNALVNQLAQSFAIESADWPTAIEPLLVAKDKTSLDVAKKRITNNRKDITPDRMTEALPMTFWVNLLAKHYETSIWTPSLRKAFVNLHKPNRAQVHDRAYEIYQLRNHLAHQGLVGSNDLARLTNLMSEFISWFSPEGHAWALKALKALKP